MSFAVWDFIFQLSRFQIRSSGGFYLCRTNPPREPYTPPTGPVLCSAGVVSLPWAQTATQGQTGPSLRFLSKNEVTPPPKGGGAGYRLFGSLGFSRREARCFSAGKEGRFVSEGFSRQLPLATAGHNWLTRAQQGPFGASVVSFPYLVLKTAHRATQGRVWFWPTDWRFSGGSPSLSEIPYKNSGRRKKHLCHAFGNPSRLSSLSRASVFQNRREKIAFLCLAAQILRCQRRTPGRMLHGIFAHKQRTRPFHGRVLIYDHAFPRKAPTRNETRLVLPQ